MNKATEQAVIEAAIDAIETTDVLILREMPVEEASEGYWVRADVWLSVNDVREYLEDEVMARTGTTRCAYVPVEGDVKTMELEGSSLPLDVLVAVAQCDETCFLRTDVGNLVYFDGGSDGIVNEKFLNMMGDRGPVRGNAVLFLKQQEDV